MENNQNINSEYEKLKASNFKQQKLPAWRPVPSIGTTIIIFLGFGIIFIIIGAVVLSYSQDIFEYSLQYSDDCKEINKVCSKKFVIDKNISSTVMFYYQLTNFYQNHRRYVKSKSNDQLLGKMGQTNDSLKSDCDPIITNRQAQKYYSINNTPLEPDEPANPCGLIAKSFFNDTYKIYKVSNNEKKWINITEKGIAWEADLNLKYKNPNNITYMNKYMWMNNTDEHFVVWMRPAGLPDFRKLWGRINGGLEEGEYFLEITNLYPQSIFNGSKSVVFSTVNAFGGKNTFLGISYIVVGVICILMAIGFFIGDVVQKKKTN